MEVSFILDRRLAIGGGIWTAEAMSELARMGFTHILNLQLEFDDSDLAADAGMESLWNPVDDDFGPKPCGFFERSAQFARRALADERSQLYVHCAAGIHRAPLAGAAILVSLGFEINDAVRVITRRRPGADFPDVYLDSLRLWAESRAPADDGSPTEAAASSDRPA